MNLLEIWILNKYLILRNYGQPLEKIMRGCQSWVMSTGDFIPGAGNFFL